jgi:hypothetical protein
MSAKLEDIPQIRLPISKTKILIENTIFIGKYLKHFPQTDCVAATGNNIAEPYHPTSSRL